MTGTPAQRRKAPTAVELRSADVLTDARAALATFEDEARAVIESVARKSDATVRWLEEDAPHYWQGAQRKANENVSATRTTFDACKLRTVAGQRSACIEEKQAYMRAKERERFCEGQRRVVRGEATNLRHGVDELMVRIRLLQRWIDGDLPKLQARLHRTAVAIAAYTATKPPAAKIEQPSPEPQASKVDDAKESP